MARKPTTNPTPKKREVGDWREPFLEALAQTGSVVRAAAAAEVHRSTAYEQRKTDAAFAARWAEAERESVERMEDEARRRAVEGCKRPIYHNGQLLTEVLDYSDTLLIFLLKAHDPKYREASRVLVGGDPNAPPIQHEHDHEHRVTLTAADLAALDELAPADEPAPEAGRGVPSDG